MQVIVISKKAWVTVLVVLALAAAAILCIVLIDGKKANPSEAEPTMAVVDSYELNPIPYTAREIPLYSVQSEQPLLAITIDAAWATDKTEFILDTLDRYNIKATFFLCGVWVEAYPDFVREIAARGHEIGNHSLTHPHMNSQSASQITQEVQKLDDEIETLTGKRCTLFRAPFGEYNDTVVKTVRGMGYEVVQWSIDTVDWKPERSAETILNAVLPKLSNGSIILCHNNGYKIEEYLPALIETALAQGYSFVTVSDLIPDTAYAIDNNGSAIPDTGA